jgi:hypothetical protein
VTGKEGRTEGGTGEREEREGRTGVREERKKNRCEGSKEGMKEGLV